MHLFCVEYVLRVEAKAELHRKFIKTSDQSINLLQMLAAFLCGETQFVPEIHNFHEIWTREILKKFHLVYF